MNSKKTAFLFPGTGVKPYGNEQDIIEKHTEVFQPLFLKVRDITGFYPDLPSFEPDSNSNGYSSELNSQLFTYCFGTGMFRLFEKYRILPCISAGYSMGVYTVLHTSKAVSFDTGIELIIRAFDIVGKETGDQDIGMCAVIGLSLKEIQRIAKSYETVLRINSNNSSCHVICGLDKELSDFSKECFSAEAIDVLTLEVTYPYHHSTLIPESGRVFRRELDSFEFKDPETPVLSTLNQQVIHDKSTLKSFIANHLSNPINWVKSLSSLYQMGYNSFVECGHGVSLTQNARFMDEYKPGWINIKNFQSRVLS